MKKSLDKLSQVECILNSLTPAKRAQMSLKYNVRNPDDPDEDTIYNVLCPLIRAGWSKCEENERRVIGKRVPVVAQPIARPNTRHEIF